jgi:hypothetical protein
LKGAFRDENDLPHRMWDESLRLCQNLRRAGTQNVMLQSSKTSLIVQHWRGELSLPVSFWLVGVLGNLVITQATVGINRGLGDPWGAGISLSVFGLTSVCQNVGIWRSAGNSIMRTGKYLWPVLARTVASFWLCLSAYATMFHPRWILE